VPEEDYDPGVTTRSRWEGDWRETGLRSGGGETAPIEQLVEDMRRDGWVAEDPIGFLGPTIRTWLDADGASMWRLREWSVDAGRLILDVAWLRAGRMRDLRADVFALIGAFAEGSTHVRQLGGDDAESVEFHVTTGEPDGEFAAHGHVVVVRAHRGG
jgi:hypothetical protein